MRFTPAQRLRKASEFQRVRAEGRCVDCGPFLAYHWLPPAAESRPGEAPRLGVVASRRVGNAVVRNRVKRRLREVFRENQGALPRDCRILLIARRSCGTRAFDELERRFIKFCERVSASDNASAH